MDDHVPPTDAPDETPSDGPGETPADAGQAQTPDPAEVRDAAAAPEADAADATEVEAATQEPVADAAAHVPAADGEAPVDAGILATPGSGVPTPAVTGAATPGSGIPPSETSPAPGAAAPGPGVPPAATFGAAPAPRRSRGAIVAISILAVALVLAIGAGAWVAVQWMQAQQRISEQHDEIEQQQDEIDEQRDLIEKKEEFGAAMTGLMGSTAKFDGVLTATIVPWEDYRRLADRAWSHRWDATKLAADTEQAELAADQLELVWSTAQQEASTNASGTTYESVIDRLGAGFVRSVLDDERCGSDDDSILGCVLENDPYLVHFDAPANTLPYMTDELRTGIAYHEFAHVLQFTNRAATEATLPAFSGDFEVMADCFALTFLDGWKLDHRVWVSSYEYWDVNIGYGQTCSEPQRQAMRDWYAQLGVQPPAAAS